MTVAEYIKGRFSSFGFTLTEADLLDITGEAGVDGEAEMTDAVRDAVSVGIARFIPSLLLRGSSWSVSENGHSRSESRDTKGIMDYYAYLCRRYGLDDELTDKPKVRFL
ncbi:MAG: hypothetical protein LUC33_02415 [Prevotellaceae bacterium]|nr:hypothetical protein [Prevotellaceae bacterium]